jgi:OOP family OmpA-OmpF porin
MTRPVLIFAPIAAALVVAFGYTAWKSAALLERWEADRLVADLAAAGQGWAAVTADGLTLRASGVAPDEAALAAATAVVQTRRWSAADFTVQPAEAAAPKVDFTLSLLRDGGTVKIAGATPNVASRAKIAALAGIGEVGDISEPHDVEAPQGWNEALDYALGALRQMPQSRILVRPGAVEIESSVASAEIRDEVEAALRAAKPPGCELILRIIAPPPALSPYRFLLEKSLDGAKVLACAAETDAQRGEILASITAALSIGAACEIALGAPSADWAAAVSAGVRAVATLPAARFELSDNEALLTATEDASKERFSEVLRDLTLNLPSSYSLLSAPPPRPAPEFTPAAQEPASPAAPEVKRWFRAVAAPDGALTLTGEAPDEATKSAILTYAQALKGAAAVEGQMRIATDRAPEGWRRAALAGLDALALLESGEAEFDGIALKITGMTETPEKIAAVAAALAPKIAEGLAAETAITVDQTALAARLPLSAAQCVAELSGAVTRDPISFAPSSAEIGEESAPVLDALAATLKRCAAEKFEIAGHTDSQGRESTNLRLSQTRADAVLDALLARGVSLEKLTAKGYGESNPIADNGSEAGRARNRRIEFTLAEEPQ